VVTREKQLGLVNRVPQALLRLQVSQMQTESVESLLRRDTLRILLKGRYPQLIGLTKLNGKYMAQMNVPLTGKEKEQFKSVLKQQGTPKLFDSKDAKIKTNKEKSLPIRGQG